jgi:hypothetical protein
MFSFCMNLMLNLIYVIRCRLCFISDCVFFCKLNVDCVFYPTVTGEQTSTRPSLIGATVAMDVFCPLVRSYHCSDALLAIGRLPMAPVDTVPNRSSARA